MLYYNILYYTKLYYNIILYLFIFKKNLVCFTYPPRPQHTISATKHAERVISNPLVPAIWKNHRSILALRKKLHAKLV